jgi:hypothetical protein
MGEEKAKDFLGKVRRRNNESYPPRASDRTLGMLMSTWADLSPLDRAVASRYNPNHVWTLSTAEGFEDADELRAVMVMKMKLGRAFNKFQTEDPESDGVQMEVKGHMMSCLSQFHVPLPQVGQELWKLSCARNMRRAVAAVFPSGKKDEKKGEEKPHGGDAVHMGVGAECGVSFGVLV